MDSLFLVLLFTLSMERGQGLQLNHAVHSSVGTLDRETLNKGVSFLTAEPRRSSLPRRRGAVRRATLERPSKPAEEGEMKRVPTYPTPTPR